MGFVVCRVSGALVHWDVAWETLHPFHCNRKTLNITKRVEICRKNTDVVKGVRRAACFPGFFVTSLQQLNVHSHHVLVHTSEVIYHNVHNMHN